MNLGHYKRSSCSNSDMHSTERGSNGHTMLKGVPTYKLIYQLTIIISDDNPSRIIVSNKYSR